MACRPTSRYEGAQYVCEGDYSVEDDAVFINALSAAMPECDSKVRSVTLDDLKTYDRPSCYVYCAQRSCDAATSYMKENKDDLAKLCSSVSYIHGGALEMDQSSLADGKACHAKIADHNMRGGLRDGCLTCDTKDKVNVKMTIQGEEISGTYYQTKPEIPDWYRRSGIVGSLPTQFSCDERYKAPVPHHNGGDKVSLDISGTGLPKDAVLAYWAAEASDEVMSAENAYGAFRNSGIVQCEESICRFHIHQPGRYTEDGKVFKSHIHVTEWEGDRWNLNAKTIDIE